MAGVVVDLGLIATTAGVHVIGAALVAKIGTPDVAVGPGSENAVAGEDVPGAKIVGFRYVVTQVAVAAVVVNGSGGKNNSAGVDGAGVTIVEKEEQSGRDEKDTEEKDGSSHEGLLVRFVKWGEARGRTARFARGTLYWREVSRGIENVTRSWRIVDGLRK